METPPRKSLQINNDGCHEGLDVAAALVATLRQSLRRRTMRSTKLGGF